MSALSKYLRKKFEKTLSTTYAPSLIIVLIFTRLKFEAEHHFFLITFIYVFDLFQMVFWDDEPLSGPEPPAGPGKQRGSVPHPVQREGQRGIRSLRQDEDKGGGDGGEGGRRKENERRSVSVGLNRASFTSARKLFRCI